MLLFQTLQRRYTYSCDVFMQFYKWLASTLEGKQAKGNIHILDGVRAIACLSVVVFHINLITTRNVKLWVPSSIPSVLNALAFTGDTGVTLFFVLSGFLLFLPYAKSLLFNDGPWPSVRQFYLRRALRILPVYYLSLILMVFIFHPEYLRIDHWRQWFLFLTMFMDSFTTTYKQINGPFWTLAVEWQFYLLLPWMALAMSWFVRQQSLQRRFLTLTFCLLALAVWGILTRFLGLYLTNAHPASGSLRYAFVRYILPFIYGPPSSGLHGKFLEDFAVGMFISSLYVLTQSLHKDHRLHSIIRRSSPWLFLFGLSLFVTMAMWKLNTGTPHTLSIFDGLNSVYDGVGEFCFALCYGCFVTSVLFGYQWLRRPFEWRPLRWIGILSYSIYMWHLLLLATLTSAIISSLPAMPNPLSYGAYLLGFLLIVVPLAFLFYILIEKPGMRLGKKYRPVRG